MDSESASQVAEASKAVKRKEEDLVSGGKLSRPEAEQVAAEIRQEYPVFKSFSVVDGGNSWDYEYVVNPRNVLDEDRPRKEEDVSAETKVHPQPSGGKANEVEVRPLAQDAESKGNCSTTAATPGEDQLTTLNTALPGKKTNWVKLHLIHCRLGGPNKGWNLIPGSIAANNKMWDWAEQPAISKLYGSDAPVMWYRTTVLSYHEPPFDTFAREINVEYGEYDVASDEKVTTVTPNTIVSPDPAEQYPDMPTANINEAGRVILERVGGIPRDVAIAIANETNYFGPFESLSDLKERLMDREEITETGVEHIIELVEKGFFVGIPGVTPEWKRES